MAKALQPLVGSKGDPCWVSLITAAIMSTPYKKMTLNDIYGWLIVNVDVCREASNFESSEGWKHYVQHTLSAEPRFVRMWDRTLMGCYWTIDEEMVETAKFHRTTPWVNLLPERNEKKFKRCCDLPELHGNDQLNEQELQLLTEMLQCAIESNPNLEQHLKALNF